MHLQPRMAGIGLQVAERLLSFLQLWGFSSLSLFRTDFASGVNESLKATAQSSSSTNCANEPRS